MRGGLTRREFAVSAAAFATIGILRSPASAAQFTYKLGHDEPLESPGNLRIVEFADAVRKESRGALDIQIFGNGALGGDPAMLSQLRSGAMQMYQAPGVSLASVVPIAGIEGIGFAFKDPNNVFAAMDGDVGAMIRKEIEAKDLVSMGKVWTIGMREVTTSTKPMVTLSDFSGLKIRTPPSKVSLELFRALGASPTPINFTESYTAMQTKIVDGQESPLTTIETGRIFEVQKYLSMTSHMWGGHWPVANKDAWKALGPDVQAIVSRNIDKYCALQRADAAQENERLRSVLAKQGLVTNVPDRAPLRKAMTAQYAQWKSDFGPSAWSALEQYTGKLV